MPVIRITRMRASATKCVCDGNSLQKSRHGPTHLEKPRGLRWKYVP